MNAEPGVITLAYHVDTWDHLGWKDPFATAYLTAKQHDACSALKVTRSYTPMMVVHGGLHTADPGEASREVRRVGMQQVISNLKVSARLGEPWKSSRSRASKDSGAAEQDSEPCPTLVLEVEVADFPSLPKGLVLYSVVAEDLLTTKCTAGENDGMTLDENSVVRFHGWLDTPGPTQRMRSKFDLVWKRENCRVVVILRDPKTWKVYGVAECKIAE